MSIGKGESTPARAEARRAFSKNSATLFARNRRRSKVTPAQRDEIVRRLKDGESPKTLALEYGLSAAHLRNWYSNV